MPTITQDLYKEITNELRNLKSDEDKEQVNINEIKNRSLFKFVMFIVIILIWIF